MKPTLPIGVLLAIACVLSTTMDWVSYVRHLEYGDQAGFALGTLFLITGMIPVTSIMLVHGIARFAPRPQALRSSSKPSESPWL